MCIRGHGMLLKFCEEFAVPYMLCGKLIVDDTNSPSTLKELYLNGLRNGCDLELIQGTTAKARLEDMEDGRLPEWIEGAILSPKTGIIDSHSLMMSLLGSAEENCDEFDVIWNCEVLDILEGSNIRLETSQGDLEVDHVINCAGLYACDMARRLTRVKSEEQSKVFPTAKFIKGNYWKAERTPGYNHLIYPIPVKNGLGTHLTMDLAGQIRFGPNVEWIESPPEGKTFQEEDFNASPASQEVYSSIRRYYPGLSGELIPDYAGIRPKLLDNSTGELLNDFYLLDESEHTGRENKIIHLLGIESPGLTSSMALGEWVSDRLEATR